jgi:hypothetical protein
MHKRSQIWLLICTQVPDQQQAVADTPRYARWGLRQQYPTHTVMLWEELGHC